MDTKWITYFKSNIDYQTIEAALITPWVVLLVQTKVSDTYGQ